MSRLNRLVQIWNWLPAFRAVAETEKLADASEKIHLSKSALSRSVQLLEESLDTDLFDRSGRNIRLNEAGETLLVGLRRAMRLLDESLEELADEPGSRNLHITASAQVDWTLTGLVSRALDGRHDWKLYVEEFPGRETIHDLLRGQLDVALVHTPFSDDNLDVEKVGSMARSVYAPRRHPLVGAHDVTREALAEHDAVLVSERRAGADAHKLRALATMTVSSLEQARMLADARGWWTVLPVAYAETAGGLEPVFFPGDLTLDVYAARRERIVEEDAVDELLGYLELG
jgi:DNA-binding transcriptional LysR family regulator